MMKYIVVLLLFISCATKKSELDEIKWDFYKKNFDGGFSIKNEVVPFYKCNLIIEESMNEKQRCFYGYFFIDEFSSVSDSNLKQGVPLVHTICYTDDLENMVGYYSGGSFYVDEIDVNREESQDQILIEIVRSSEVVDFLEHFN